MVVSKSMAAAKIRTNVHEFTLDSGKKIKFVAPRNVVLSKDIVPIMRPAEGPSLGKNIKIIISKKMLLLVIMRRGLMYPKVRRLQKKLKTIKRQRLSRFRIK